VQGSPLSAKWEPLLNNLGHASRKLGDYDAALDYHKSALVLRPAASSASTHSAIGYAYALKGDLLEAAEAFHRALAVRRDDTFATTMLNSVVEQLANDDLPFPGEGKISPFNAFQAVPLQDPTR